MRLCGFCNSYQPDISQICARCLADERQKVRREVVEEYRDVLEAIATNAERAAHDIGDYDPQGLRSMLRVIRDMARRSLLESSGEKI